MFFLVSYFIQAHMYTHSYRTNVMRVRGANIVK